MRAIRIDANQGVHGLGEVRDAGVEGMAIILKHHIIGRNPLGIALHDSAGKVHGVPCWPLIGSKDRDELRLGGPY